MLAATVLMAGQFLARSVMVGGVERRYQVWVPGSYAASRKTPAILFLHGSGERGDDGDKQTRVGLGPALRSGKVDVAAIVVFPQCPAGERWVGPATKIAIAALDATEKEFPIDRSRVSLTGMSMGGAGAWFLAATYPSRWSAVAPVCGYVHRPPSLPDAEEPSSEPYATFARQLPHVPIWIFHGSDDPVVPVGESRNMAEALNVRAGYTEFAHTGHNAWDPAYTTTHVVQWLVDQKRQRTPAR
ncbi:MAG TPA: alpha/beta hydrolase-fold protein [Thermoanaerobaculia bacterium]|nr:alpha/beta hydrolase-fold protein [Thermoanaerobaculia bacterium]